MAATRPTFPSSSRARERCPGAGRTVCAGGGRRLRALRRLGLLFVALVLVHGGRASADDIIFRGNYWRDRNTRVIQPEVDLQRELPSGTLVGGHYLLDTITSASVAAGALRDEPFTELRNEAGFRLGQRMKTVTLTGAYQYSQESDYRAQTASLSLVAELFQKNTTVGATVIYGHDNIYARMGPTQFAPDGALDKVGLILSVSQLLSPTASVSLSYDLGVNGFGTKDNGMQANPYRPVNVGGSPTREAVPFQRLKHTLAASLTLLIPIGSAAVPWIGWRPSYRLYLDDWGIVSHTPELRVFLPTGPLEWRVTGRLYTQGQASFYSAGPDDLAFYAGQGLPCSTCTSKAVAEQLYFAADPKLSEFWTQFIEARLLIKLRFLRRAPRWISDSTIAVSYGHLFTERAVYRTFGQGHVAGLELQLPL